MNTSLELKRILDRVGGRFRQLRLWVGLAVCWLVFALVGLAVLTESPPSRVWSGVLAVVAALAGLAWWMATRRVARDRRWIARRIERRHPELSALLLTAVEQESKSLGFLEASVVESALAHGRSHHNWDDTVPQRGLRTAQILHGLTLAGLIAILGFFGFRTLTPEATAEALPPVSTEAGLVVEVEPGHTEIERGNPLLVIAKFPDGVPVEASLVVEGADGSKTARPMFRSLDDPTFSAHLPTVDADLSYRVEFNNDRSESFRVKVFEHPELRRVTAKLAYPAYTNLQPKTVEDVRHVTVVEGSQVTLLCQLNKPVTKAVLTDEKNEERPLTAVESGKNIYQVTLTATATQRYRLRLTDADGRANKQPSDITLRVTPNLPPVVTVPQPGRDMRVSPLEELSLKADLKDDFGLIRYGLSVNAPDGTARDLVLKEVEPKQIVKKAQPDHLLALESFKAQPDQVLSYYFWAEDIGPDGQRRRASGDLYFAEVRHFEEIFREGEQQTREQQEREQQDREQGQGENAEQADKLAEMQKQIINATWKLIRREVGPTPTEKFAEDAALIQKTQQAVIEQAEAFRGKLQSPASVNDLAQAMKFMKLAAEQLGAVVEKTSPALLPPALASEQAAYQALMKLRAREFNVTQNNSRRSQNSRSSSSNSRSPSQQQLRQLDLAKEENRYETQSEARARQEQQAKRDQEQRENNELADRLKELARRQNDLTDRVKELQSAMEQAKDAKQKEELQQQLKRLRDQQQQVLRDTDELQERLEKPENQERMADAKSQVEESRESVRQASEALEKGQLQQAVNEGTRAGRQMDNLREQLRKDSANRFGEEMRDLRKQARQLDEEQDKLTKKLDEMKQTQKPGLRDSGEKTQVQKGLEEQQKQFNDLNERIQKTVQEAEKPEPLLAQELFNTARTATEQKVGESLNLARQLTQAGGIPDAADASRKAKQGTEQLRQGIEKAAESVLGGQTEALKRAGRELDELAEQVNREVEQATGEPQPGQTPKGPPKQKDGPNPKDGAGRNPMPGQKEGTTPKEGGGRNPMPGAKEGTEAKEGSGANPMPGQKEGTEPKEGGGRNPMPGQKDGTLQNPMPGGRRSLTDPPMPKGQQPGDNERSRPGQPVGERTGPIREEGFRQWTDRMRAAEELIEDPQLRAEAARIRDRVREAREEFKRHSKEPDWKKMQDLVTKPLNELRGRVAEEIRRRESPDSLTPIDRDPVPPQFSDGVRRYYERLGSDR